MAKKPPKLSITVILSKELYEKTDRVAVAEDRSMASVIRRLLEQMPEPERKARAS